MAARYIKTECGVSIQVFEKSLMIDGRTMFLNLKADVPGTIDRLADFICDIIRNAHESGRASMRDEIKEILK